MKRANLLSLVAQMEGIKRRPPDAEPEFPSIFSRLRGFCHHKCRGCSVILTALHSLQRSSKACSIPASTCQASCECSSVQSCRPQIPRTLVDVQCSREFHRACASVQVQSAEPTWTGDCVLESKSRCGRGCSSAHVCARAGTGRIGKAGA